MTITQDQSRLVQYSPDVRFLAKTSYAFCILDSNSYSQAGTCHSQTCCNEVVKLVGSFFFKTVIAIPNRPLRGWNVTGKGSGLFEIAIQKAEEVVPAREADSAMVLAISLECHDPQRIYTDACSSARMPGSSILAFWLWWRNADL